MPAPPDVLTFDPEAYRGRNALLLVFAPSPKSPAYQSQMDLFQGAEGGFQARSLLLVQLLFEGESHLNEHRLHKASAQAVRERYGVASDAFSLVLLDQGGQERRRYDTPVKPEALFEALDGPSRA
jgi:hypothetical protein